MPTIGLSGFTRTLVGGSTYNVVTTGFANNSFGASTLRISLLANLGVPEPATWAMMIAGFGTVGIALRRQRGVTAKVRFAA